MGPLDFLAGKLVGLDTAPIIYLIEEHPQYLSLVLPVFEAAKRGDIRFVTSTVTLLEVLVQPLRNGHVELAPQYRAILMSAANITIVPVSTEIAERAAFLRATYGLRTPDSIQLAASLISGASAFLTNDDRLPKIAGLQLVVLKQYLDEK